MNPLAITPAFTGEIEIPADAIKQRDEVITTSKQITGVSSQEELESAVAVLRDLTNLEKVTETGRVTEKRPFLDFSKLIDSFAAKFIAPVVTEKTRITQYVNEWQRKESARKAEEARKVAEEKRKADEALAKAQQAIEAAKTPEKKLAAQLQAEEVSMLKQSLSVVAPSNTPVGLATRVSYDFEIVDPRKAIATFQPLFIWKPGEEAWHFNRAFLRKQLNAETPNEYTTWRPPEGTDSVVMSDYGIRVFVSVKTNVRG